MLTKDYRNSPAAVRMESRVLAHQGDHRSPRQLSILYSHNNKLSFQYIAQHIFIYRCIIYFTLWRGSEIEKDRQA